MTLPHPKESPPGSAEEARRDAEAYAAEAAETAEQADEAARAMVTAVLAVAARLGQLAAVLAARPPLMVATDNERGAQVAEALRSYGMPSR